MIHIAQCLQITLAIVCIGGLISIVAAILLGFTLVRSSQFSKEEGTQDE